VTPAACAMLFVPSFMVSSGIGDDSSY
jgi:hypothetical protein